MTKQTIFNKVVRFLREQNAQSKDLGACKFRSKDGLKCAVGCLIPDKNYIPKMDEQCRSAYMLNDIGLLPAHLEPYIGFLSELQTVHDCYAVSYWEQQWELVAVKHNLKVPA